MHVENIFDRNTYKNEANPIVATVSESGKISVNLTTSKQKKKTKLIYTISVYFVTF